jgi:hypothetical protein
MPATSVVLTTKLPSIGSAEVLIGDPYTASGLESLGLTEGDITAEVTFSENALTADEWTGAVPHEVETMVENAIIRVPVIVTNDDLYERIHPTGTKSGGWSAPQFVQEFSTVLIPRKQLGASLANTTGLTAGWVRLAGNGVLGATAADASPTHATWLWRSYAMPGARTLRRSAGGKAIIEVAFRAMFDVTRPEGHRVYTLGDPTTQGIADVRM